MAKTSYDTNSLRLITPRLCTYNVNVNRPYCHVRNINRMFMVDMTYMPGYFIEQYPHKFYKNRAASWSPGNRPVALPPGLTKAGFEEKKQLQEYIQDKERQNSNSSDKSFKNHRASCVGSRPIEIKGPSLNLLSREYKRPLTMYDKETDYHHRRSLSSSTAQNSNNKAYTIFPALKTPTAHKNAKNSDKIAAITSPRASDKYTAGKCWSMDRFKMWSGGTEGSVEFPKGHDIMSHKRAAWRQHFDH